MIPFRTEYRLPKNLEIPMMHYLDGEEVSLEDRIELLSNERHGQVIGFCSLTGMNVIDTGDELITIHGSYINAWEL